MKPILGTGNRVFFKEEEQESNKTEIFIPGQVKKITYGVVTAVSEKDSDDKTPIVKVGDEILISSNAMIGEAKFKGEKLFYIRESDIIAILN